ncbi:MAG: DEAD/DEAH box helicase [Candidatus Dojkabacteria bacterium]|nr:MAG: DEAD/DEAH box helicase [Candidatus Dojkabacteria bacterium]
MDDKRYPSRQSGHGNSSRSGRNYGNRRPFSSDGDRSGGSRFGGRRFNSFGGSGGRSRFGGRGGRRGGGGGSVDISSFIRRAQQDAIDNPAVEYTAKHAFKDFGFVVPLEKNIIRRQYAQPTPIQDQAIPAVLEGRDVVGLANTGTGKTAAFLLPLMNKLYQNPREQAIILVPVRELADQIMKEFTEFAQGIHMSAALCIGGTPIGRQIQMLRRHPQIVIGTPGRIKDLYERKILNLSGFTTVILDEVDRMFDMGFSEDISFILSKLPEQRQSLFFSATMPGPIKKLADTFLKDPVEISVKTRETAANVTQETVHVQSFKKIETLVEMLKKPEFEKVLIFVKTKRGTEDLRGALERQQVTAETIHGDKPQGKRLFALKLFRDNKIRVLIATDVAARGLDIKDVTHVINYDKPGSYEDYVHRIGRTGRGNKKGTAVTFI